VHAGVLLFHAAASSTCFLGFCLLQFVGFDAPSCGCKCCFCIGSTALHTTSIWSNTIGLQQEQAGTNSVIEAQIYAPGGGGGGGRAAKRQRAQELIEASACQVGRAASHEIRLTTVKTEAPAYCSMCMRECTSKDMCTRKCMSLLSK
jgi:hypothetical protein